MNRVLQWLQKIAGKQDSQRQEAPRVSIKPEVAAHILDVWLEQVGSLKQLRMHEHATRIMNRARAITLESMQADPADPMAWINIGRVQTVDEYFDEATEVFEHARSLAKQQGNEAVEGIAGSGLFIVMRRQAAGKDVDLLDLSQPLTEAKYRQYERQQLEEACYVCQGCGHLNLMLGEHCAHCRFAPENLEQARLSISLSSMYFNTTTLLRIGVNLQQGKNPLEFIDGLEVTVRSIDSDMGILQKIQDNQEDDHLDFNAIDRCASCGKKVWHSNATVCTHCSSPLERPMLLRLAICVDRLLQQWIWTVQISDAREFRQWVLLLVNMKYQLIRSQMAPTDVQRHKATQLLLQLSPLYTQNRGGVVRIQNPATVVSEVLDSSVHEDIGPTVDYLRDEVTHFLYLVSDSVSLF